MNPATEPKTTDWSEADDFIPTPEVDDEPPFDLEDPEPQPPEPQSEGGEAEAAPPERDFVREVQQLKALYPDLQEMPDEVAKAAAEGADLLTAYVAYREKQTYEAAEVLRKENQVLKQNAAAAAKAPVRGITGGGAADTKPRSGLLAGFDDDGW